MEHLKCIGKMWSMWWIMDEWSGIEGYRMYHVVKMKENDEI